MGIGSVLCAGDGRWVCPGGSGAMYTGGGRRVPGGWKAFAGGGSHSVVSDSVSPWTVACQACWSMGFSRHRYWTGLPVPSPGHLPNPGIRPGSLALQMDSLPSGAGRHTWNWSQWIATVGSVETQDAGSGLPKFSWLSVKKRNNQGSLSRAGGRGGPLCDSAPESCEHWRGPERQEVSTPRCWELQRVNRPGQGADPGGPAGVTLPLGSVLGCGGVISPPIGIHYFSLLLISIKRNLIFTFPPWTWFTDHIPPGSLLWHFPSLTGAVFPWNIRPFCVVGQAAESPWRGAALGDVSVSLFLTSLRLRLVSSSWAG